MSPAGAGVRIALAAVGLSGCAWFDGASEPVEPAEPAIASAAPPMLDGLRLKRTGVAFAVRADGLYLTAAHVVEGCDRLMLSPLAEADRPRDAKLSLDDPRLDLALLETTPPADAAPARASATGAPQAVTVFVAAPGPAGAEPSPVLAKAVAAPHQSRADAVALIGPVRPGHSGAPVLGRAGGVLGVAVQAPAAPEARGVGMAIHGAAMARFLARRRIALPTQTAAEPLSPEALRAKARAMLARLDCYAP